jgi:L-ascorbate peroxidase
MPYADVNAFYYVQVRLGWHDSGTYDKNIEEWPQRGGADGSLRFDPELSHGANAGICLDWPIFSVVVPC